MIKTNFLLFKNFMFLDSSFLFTLQKWTRYLWSRHRLIRLQYGLRGSAGFWLEKMMEIRAPHIFGAAGAGSRIWLKLEISSRTKFNFVKSESKSNITFYFRFLFLGSIENLRNVWILFNLWVIVDRFRLKCTTQFHQSTPVNFM